MTETTNAAKAARRAIQPAFRSTFFQSLFVNVLMLTGPLFMLQIYDRVLSSGSVETLVALSVLVVALYGFYGIFEWLRARMLAHAGQKFDSLLAEPTFQRIVEQENGSRIRLGSQPAQDLDTVRQVLSGPALLGLFDAPWAPIFLLVIALLHPALGLFALGGVLLLLVLSVLNDRKTRPLEEKAQGARQDALLGVEEARRAADAVRAMGFGHHLAQTWMRRHADGQAEGDLLARRQAGFSALSRSLRLLLQSGILAFGALLALSGQVSAGAIIAGSILMSRAVAPIDALIGNWRGLVAARQAYDRLVTTFEKLPEAEGFDLPAPSGQMSVENIVVAAPGTRMPLVRGVAFSLEPGDGLGIIGPSGAGKTVLARALTGLWTPIAGSVRIDGATYDQFPADALGRQIGYLPQEVALIDGTIAQNIGRFDPEATADDLIEAARKAGVYDFILRLPDGFRTRIGNGGMTLSGGQRQRIALARALYGNPRLLVLDEANSNLDRDGEAALNGAIARHRAEGGTVIVIAHRMGSLEQLNKLLVLEDGQMKRFDLKENIVKPVAAPAAAPAAAGGGPARIAGRKTVAAEAPK